MYINRTIFFLFIIFCPVIFMEFDCFEKNHFVKLGQEQSMSVVSFKDTQFALNL